MIVQVGLALQTLVFADKIGIYICNILEGLALIGSLVFVSILLFFHCYIASKNTTTNEYCKKVWEGISGNPFEKYSIYHLEVAALKISSRSSATTTPYSQTHRPIYSNAIHLSSNQGKIVSHVRLKVAWLEFTSVLWTLTTTASRTWKGVEGGVEKLATLVYRERTLYLISTKWYSKFDILIFQL